MTAAILCFFTALSDIPKSKLTVRSVLAGIAQAGGYSIFDATASNKHARIIDAIERRGLICRVDPSEYPWVNVEVTWAGRALIGEENK